MRDSLVQLSYTQFWNLIAEGHVERVRFIGPAKQSVLVKTLETAPGGVRACKVGLRVKGIVTGQGGVRACKLEISWDVYC